MHSAIWYNTAMDITIWIHSSQLPQPGEHWKNSSLICTSVMQNNYQLHRVWCCIGIRFFVSPPIHSNSYIYSLWTPCTYRSTGYSLCTGVDTAENLAYSTGIWILCSSVFIRFDHRLRIKPMFQLGRTLSFVTNFVHITLYWHRLEKLQTNEIAAVIYRLLIRR